MTLRFEWSIINIYVFSCKILKQFVKLISKCNWINLNMTPLWKVTSHSSPHTRFSKKTWNNFFHSLSSMGGLVGRVRGIQFMDKSSNMYTFFNIIVTSPRGRWNEFVVDHHLSTNVVINHWSFSWNYRIISKRRESYFFKYSSVSFRDFSHIIGYVYLLTSFHYFINYGLENLIWNMSVLIP